MSALRDFLLHRILSGQIQCQIGSNQYFLKPPTTLVRFYAAEVYKEALYEAQLEGLYTEEESIDILRNAWLWSDQKEARLKGLEKDIEELKVKLFSLTFRSNERKIVRETLKKAKEEIIRLWGEKHLLSNVTDIAVAHLAKIHYIVSQTLVNSGNELVIKDPNSYIVDEALRTYADCTLSEPQYRDLVQHEPWLSYWMANKAHIFPQSVLEWSDEQRQLVIWSKFYDSLKENPDCPSDEVIADDDMLDGWCILQRRKRESEDVKREVEGKISHKVSQAGEIFIPTDTIEDARKVNSLNDIQGQIVKKQIFNKIKQEGTVKELDMPDVRQKIVMEANKMWAEQRKGG